LWDRKGATAAEFAIILPIFVTLLVGLFQFGWMQHSASSVRATLEQASRRLLLNPAMSEAELQTFVRNRLDTSTAPEVTVTLNVTGSGANRVARLTGDYVHLVGVPPFAAFPVNYSTTVMTPLPPS